MTSFLLASAAPDKSWWDTTKQWIEGSGQTAFRIILIVLAAAVIWGIGRLIIRSIVKGITRGFDVAEDATRSVLDKANLLDRPDELEAQRELEQRLEEQRRATRANTIGVVLRAALNVVVIAITVLMILGELHVSVAPILASAGVAGVALGFGAQSLVKDLLSGLFMLIEDQYGVGDVVDLGEASGVVENFGLRSTRLRSLDGTVWYVPNGEVQRVGNKTQLWSRVLIEVRFDLDVDPEAARQAMLDAAAAAAKDEEIAAAILDDPQVPGVEQLDFNAVMLRLLIQVQPSQQWAVQRAIRAEMRKVFRARGIELAAPTGNLIQHVRARGPQL